ncbi:MAG: hypothetical protein GYB68_20200, partial [Chloroflexi bacterium]|nr:hypothetical protein [Chloroflexota bacterium]
MAIQLQSALNLTSHTSGVQAVAFSPDGNVLASGTADGTITLWTIPRGGQSATLAARAGAINQLAFSKDGSHIAAACGDGTVRIWQMPSGRVPETLLLDARHAHSVAFSPIGNLLAAGTSEGTIGLYQLDAPAEYARTGSGGIRGTGSLNMPGTRPQSIFSAANDDPTVLRSKKLVYSVDFSPDGKMLIAGVDDGSIRVFEITEPGKPEYRAMMTIPAQSQYPVYSAKMANHTVLLAS